MKMCNNNIEDRIYANAGNPPLLNLLDGSPQRVLDIGCGAGNNAALIRTMYPDCKVFGITHSTSEADFARRYVEVCWVFDIENEFPEDLMCQTFDTLVFSHILEHLKDPARSLVRFLTLLVPGGAVLIAVPNVLNWRQRIQFLFGQFQYESSGVLDDTHLRFFTYFTANRYLLSQSPNLTLVFNGVNSNVPLWLLRRYVFPKVWCEQIDAWGGQHWPNLFGWQVLIKAKKQ